MDKVAIIGLGLIGGSLALELKKHSWASIFGVDTNNQHLEKALDLGLIVEGASIDIVAEVDTVIIAVPVDKIPSIATAILDRIQPTTLVLDVGSTKKEVCKAILNHPKRKNFVAAHPIAGTEFSGPEAAIYDLFSNKINIICEQHLSDAQFVAKTVALFERFNMNTVFMDSAEQHDKHIAYVSHLSHISSFMLGKTVLEIEEDEKNIFNMAGSGFKSTVRLAKSNPKTWTPIFLENKDNILQSLEEYIKNLEQFKQLLERDQKEDIFNIMQNTNRIQSVLAGIKTR